MAEQAEQNPFEYRNDAGVLIQMRPVESEWELLQIDDIVERIETFASSTSESQRLLKGMKGYQQWYAFAMLCTIKTDGVDFKFVPSTSDGETLAGNLQAWLSMPRAVYQQWQRLVDAVLKDYKTPPKN